MMTDVKSRLSRVANVEGTVSYFSTTRTELERHSRAFWSIFNNHHVHLPFSRLQEHFQDIDLNKCSLKAITYLLYDFLQMPMTLSLCQTANPYC
jgi:hypothetical protein